MTNTEKKNIKVYIDNANRKIRYADGAEHDLGVSLLSFVDLDANKKHPYVKYFQADKEANDRLEAKDRLETHYGENILACLSLNPTETIKLNPPVVRLYKWKNGDVGYNGSLGAVNFNMHHETAKEAKSDYRLFEVYDVPDLAALCYIEFMKMIELGLNVRRCQNCQLLFIPKWDYEVKYCDRIPPGETRNCQYIGSHKLFQQRVKDDPLLREYNKIYRRFHSQKRYGILSDDEFKGWTELAKELRKEAKKKGKEIDGRRVYKEKVIETFVKELIAEREAIVAKRDTTSV